MHTDAEILTNNADNMLTINKLNGGGYDVLKFIMSILIVAIHSHAFYGDWTSVYLRPITYIAVPVFFILSSFFYFRKIHINGFNMGVLWHFVSRIGLLYLFWFIVKLPFVLHEHHYFISGGINDVWRLMKDILFRYTFSGSWFLSALVIAVIFFSLCHKYRITQLAALLVSILILFYFHCIDLLPIQYHGFYDWWHDNVRPAVTLTFMEALPWVGLGYLLSTPKSLETVKKLSKTPIPLMTLIVLLLLALYVFIVNCKMPFLSTLVSLIVSSALVILAGAFNLPNSPIYTHLRKLSILFYMFHFVLIYVSGIIGRYLQLDLVESMGYFLYFVMILAFSFICAEAFIYLSSKKYLSWLKYGY